ATQALPRRATPDSDKASRESSAVPREKLALYFRAGAEPAQVAHPAPPAVAARRPDQKRPDADWCAPDPSDRRMSCDGSLPSALPAAATRVWKPDSRRSRDRWRLRRWREF